jgi:hypothetical protein
MIDEEFFKIMHNSFSFDREFKIREPKKFDISVLMMDSKHEKIIKSEFVLYNIDKQKFLEFIIPDKLMIKQLMQKSIFNTKYFKTELVNEESMIFYKKLTIPII